MFTLMITLGNDAMQTPEDVAAALPEVISWLERGFTQGRIHDANGNHVGQFEFKPADETED